MNDPLTELAAMISRHHLVRIDGYLLQTGRSHATKCARDQPHSPAGEYAHRSAQPLT
jgi:hypothetical protein